MDDRQLADEKPALLGGGRVVVCRGGPRGNLHLALAYETRSAAAVGAPEADPDPAAAPAPAATPPSRQAESPRPAEPLRPAPGAAAKAEADEPEHVPCYRKVIAHASGEDPHGYGPNWSNVDAYDIPTVLRKQMD